MLGVSLAGAAVSAGLTVLRFIELDQRLLLGLVPIAPWIFVAFALLSASLYSRAVLAGAGVVSIAAVLAALPGPVLPRSGCNTFEATGDRDVVVYSHNVFVSGADQQTIVAQIESVNADIVVLQEADSEFVESLALPFDEYPHRSQEGGQVTFSRWEFASDDEVAVDIVGALDVSVDSPAGLLRVINVHSPWPLKPGGRDTQVQQFELLSEALADNDAMPIVAIGDFNATPSDARYRSLASGDSARGPIVDAHREAGCGFGVGWSPIPGVVPALLSIDHAIVAGASVENFQVLDYAGGDHKGIAVHLSLEES